VSETAAPEKPWPAVSLAQARAILTVPGSRFEMEEKLIRGVPTRVWKSAPPTLRDVFLAGVGYGERPFLVYEQERTSYRAFSRAALALSQALRNARVRKGDRVAIAMRNLPEWPAAFFGALLTGAIAVPLNAWWTGAELEYALKDSGSKVAFLDAERFERLAEHLPRCPELERLYVSRDEEEIAHPKVTKLEDVLGRTRDWEGLPDRAVPDVPLDPDGDATIFYTSGTTGHPKGAFGTHRNSTSAIIAGAYSLAQACVRRGDPVPQPGAQPRSYLLVVPFFHATGCQAILIPALFQGAKIVLMHRWDAEAAMHLIERERGHSCRRRADHRLAIDRASGPQPLRSLLAADGELRGSAGRFRARAPHQAGVSAFEPRFRLGHDGNRRHLHDASGRGLSQPPRKLRPRGSGLRHAHRGRLGRDAAGRRGR
jgi:long-chain acyl-CoA synthetase